MMQVVCEATQSSSADTQLAAFECLVKIVGLYYDKMGLYMEKALFGLTVAGMKSDNEQVALQAVEFWSTVCEEELMLEEGESYGFAAGAMNELLPVLLWLLSKTEEDDGFL